MKPFDHEKFIGYISEVSAQTVLMQFPVAPLVHPFYYHGSVYLSGSVGSFVVIEGTERGFLGRLIEVSLPQGERKEITDQNTHMESDEFPSYRQNRIAGYIQCICSRKDRENYI